jgi:membrane protease YdiL (CAAX protease family)
MSTQAATIGNDVRPSSWSAAAVFLAIFVCRLLIVPLAFSRLFPQADPLAWWTAQPAAVEFIQQAAVIALLLYLAGPEALGLTRGKGAYAIVRAAGLSFGLMAVITSSMVQVVAVTGWGLASPVGIKTGIAESVGWLSLTALIVTSPIEEELLVRGYLLPALMRPMGIVGAVAISNLLWTACHLGRPWYALATTFVTGLFLSWARISSGSLWPCIAAHMMFNTVPPFVMALWPMFIG